MLNCLLAMPSTALAHPAVAARDAVGVAGLRDAVAGLLAGHSPWEPVVVVAPDPAAQEGPVVMHPRGQQVHLGGLGLPEVSVRVGRRSPLDLTTVEAHPGADLAVLTTLVAHHWSGARITPVGIPVAAAAVEGDAGSAFADAVAGASDKLTVVVAGDLAAGHGPKPPRPDVGAERAAAFDAAVVDALDDPDRLVALLTESSACGARGLPALVVAARLAGVTGWSAGDVAGHRVAGVGGVTVRWS